ncbi:MAG TPA: hypothetical protein VF474_06345, partial [Phenylobacterium sp.]
ADCALNRRESRGGHFRADFPDARQPARTFVTLDRIDLAGLKYAAE